MTCPFCGKEMEPGRLTAGGYWIRWIPEGGIDLMDPVTVSPMSLRNKGTPAQLCQTCRKVIADLK